VGKPNERERERERERDYLAFRKVQNSSNITFPAKTNTSQPQKNSPKNSALENTPKSIQLYDLLQICASKNVPSRVLYGLHSMAQQQQEELQKMPRFSCQMLPRKPCPNFLLYGLYVPKSIQLYDHLQICASKNVPSSVVRPAQYGPAAARRTPENASVFVPNAASKTVPKLLVVRTVRIRTVWPNTKNLSCPSSQCVLHTTQCIFL
jgi:hypothetical protein